MKMNIMNAQFDLWFYEIHELSIHNKDTLEYLCKSQLYIKKSKKNRKIFFSANQILSFAICFAFLVNSCNCTEMNNAKDNTLLQIVENVEKNSIKLPNRTFDGKKMRYLGCFLKNFFLDEKTNINTRQIFANQPTFLKINLVRLASDSQSYGIRRVILLRGGSINRNFLAEEILNQFMQGVFYSLSIIAFFVMIKVLLLKFDGWSWRSAFSESIENIQNFFAKNQIQKFLLFIIFAFSVSKIELVLFKIFSSIFFEKAPLNKPILKPGNEVEKWTPVDFLVHDFKPVRKNIIKDIANRGKEKYYDMEIIKRITNKLMSDKINFTSQEERNEFVLEKRDEFIYKHKDIFAELMTDKLIQKFGDDNSTEIKVTPVKKKSKTKVKKIKKENTTKNEVD